MRGPGNKRSGIRGERPEQLVPNEADDLRPGDGAKLLHGRKTFTGLHKDFFAVCAEEAALQPYKALQSVSFHDKQVKNY